MDRPVANAEPRVRTAAERSPAGPSPRSGAAIVADGLEKRFGDFVAVDRISFEAPAGSVFGLLGANGAGKSTAIRMLCGLLAPSGGRAVVAGIDVSADPEAVKRRIGYMSQKFSLYEDLTVRENAEFFSSLYGVGGGRRGKEMDSALGRAFELTGLIGSGQGSASLEKTLAGDLSAGYRQRLALACAVAHRPKVLFLDEPTAGVDPLARRLFWDLIYTIVDDGATVLVTTHYLDEAEYCSTVTLMRDGRIVASGSPGELKRANFPGPLLEVQCGAPRRALEALQADASVEEAAMFGTRVHVALAAGASEERVASLLRKAGAEPSSMERIEPSLEDAFIKIVSRGDGGGSR